VDVLLLGEPLPVELMDSLHRADDGAVRYDALRDAGAVREWLEAVGDRLPRTGGRDTAAAVAPGEAASAGAHLRELRAALRALAAESTGHRQEPPDSPCPSLVEAVATVNRMSALAEIRPELAWPRAGVPVRELGSAAAPGALAVALVARDAVDLFAGPVRAQLRACLAPGCDRYFVKQHARQEWCTPSCGNRARVARHYRRHHGGDREPGRTGAGRPRG
jgi:predicted RNA-binding Zn ribbon-like protein